MLAKAHKIDNFYCGLDNTDRKLLTAIKTPKASSMYATRQTLTPLAIFTVRDLDI